MTTTRTTSLRDLVGSGHKVGLLALPVLLVGLLITVARPEFFEVGGPPTGWVIASWICLLVGLTLWVWSVVLILTRVPRGQLITTGPYRLVRHPLYVSVALLVLPAAGLLLNSWLGALVGTALYCGSRVFAPEEDAELEQRFGSAWHRYRHTVLLPRV
jgi:protein-S-isoprenylcysteine O-methyltransferase Ste14